MFGHDKHIFSRDKTFVAESILVSRQKTCFVATKDVFCRDKHVFWGGRLGEVCVYLQRG